MVTIVAVGVLKAVDLGPTPTLQTGPDYSDAPVRSGGGAATCAFCGPQNGSLGPQKVTSIFWPSIALVKFRESRWVLCVCTFKSMEVESRDNAGLPVYCIIFSTSSGWMLCIPMLGDPKYTSANSLHLWRTSGCKALLIVSRRSLIPYSCGFSINEYPNPQMLSPWIRRVHCNLMSAPDMFRCWNIFIFLQALLEEL